MNNGAKEPKGKEKVGQARSGQAKEDQLLNTLEDNIVVHCDVTKPGENIVDKSVNTIPYAKNSSTLSSHSNPNFEGNQEVPLSTEKSILDSNKHSAVAFKENVQPNFLGDMGDGQNYKVDEGIVGTGARFTGRKFSRGRKGKNHNKTIHDKKYFKISNTQVPLFESMSSMAELIKSQFLQGASIDCPKESRK
ncbi:hypothetical protein ERO13_A12G072233v2 [Gossypium hirsutum]|nr:hypothetical protein ERO13_A12G072233v2 [Gossypium hirsutum]